MDNLEGKLEGMEARIEAWVRVNVEKKLAKEDNHIGWVMANSDSIFNGKTNGIMSHEKTNLKNNYSQ